MSDTEEHLTHLIAFLKDLETSIRKSRQDFENCQRKLVYRRVEEAEAAARIKEIASKAVGIPKPEE